MTDPILQEKIFLFFKHYRVLITVIVLLVFGVWFFIFVRVLVFPTPVSQTWTTREVLQPVDNSIMLLPPGIFLALLSLLCVLMLLLDFREKHD